MQESQINKIQNKSKNKTEDENEDYAFQAFQRRLPNLPNLYNWTHFKWKKNENPASQNGCTKRPQIINIQEYL